MTSFAQRAKAVNMSQIGKEAAASRQEREKQAKTPMAGLRKRNWGAAERLEANEFNAPPTLIDDVSDAPVFEEVPLAKVIENPYNAREIYDADRIEKLAASIKLDGQLVPAIGVRRGDKYLLIAGHYRFKALRRGDAPTVKMMVYAEDAVSDQKIYEFSFKENEERSEQTVMDNAAAWRRVLDAGVYESISALSEAIGVTQPTITKTLSMLTMPEAVLEVVRSAPEAYGLSIAYELQRYARVAPLAKAIEMAERVKAKDVLRREIIAAREELEQEKPNGRTRKNQMSRSYDLRYGEGSVKEWDNGRVQVDIQFQGEEDKAHFMHYIQSYTQRQEVE